MKALFLDRDGVLNVLRHNDYVKCPDELVILPGVKEAMALLRKHYDLILIVTNQQGIGKGLMTEADLTAVSPISEWLCRHAATTQACG